MIFKIKLENLFLLEARFVSSIFPVTLGKVVICDKKYGVIMDCTITQSQKIYKDFVNQIANEGWSNIHAIIAHKDP